MTATFTRAALLACLFVCFFPVFSPGGAAHAADKPCGLPGGPTCPLPPPMLGPPSFVRDDVGGRWESVGQIASDYSNWAVNVSDRCSAPFSGAPEVSSGPWGNTPFYYLGIPYQRTYRLSFAEVWRKYPPTGGWPPSCAESGTHYINAFSTQPVFCPNNAPIMQSGGVGYCGTVSPNPPAPRIEKVPGSCDPGSSASGTNSGGANSGTGRTFKGNPCDVSNGNKYQAEVDYQGGGANTLRFVRSYNSIVANLAYLYTSSTDIPRSEPIGAGWTATYFQSLRSVTGSSGTVSRSAIYAFRPDGRLLTFNLYNGAYVPDADVSDTLRAIPNGFEYRTAGDILETYDSDGRLISVAERGAPATTLTYAPAIAYPSTVTDAYGHSLTFTYQIDANRVTRLASVTDPAGNAISYAYTASNNTRRQGAVLSSVTYPDGKTRIYGYGAANSPLAQHLTQLTDEAGVAFASWTYSGGGGGVLTSQHAGGVDSYQFAYTITGGQNKRTVTDPLGTARTYTMQIVQGVSRVVGSSSTCGGCADDAGRSYDASGNMLTRTDFNGNVTNYLYDIDRNLETSRTEAFGSPRARTITTQWDATYRQPTLITEPNRTTAFTYDSSGRLLTRTVTDTSSLPTASRTWTWTYDSNGRVLTSDGPRTDVSDVDTYTYYTCTTGSECGQVHTITNALNQTTTFNSYNAHGQPLVITDPNGVATTLAYDLRQRLTSRQVGAELTTFEYWPTGLLKKATLPDSSYLLYTYDGAHRLTRIDDSNGNRIEYTLDAMGNRTAERSYDPSNALARSRTQVFNALNQLWKQVASAGTSAVTTAFGYDSNGNQNAASAPLGRSTSSLYDELNRLKQVTDPGLGVTQYAYDANDNLASVTDPRSLVTSYTYNGFGDATGQTSPDTGATSNSYDSGGNLATQTDSRAKTATYSYDALNRVTAISYPDLTTSFTYDAGANGVGRLTGASDANHSLSWSYDSQGRIITKAQTVGAITKSVVYGYTNGNLTSITTPSGQVVGYGYVQGRVTSVTLNGGPVLSQVLYDPFGPARQWTWGNGTLTNRTYDLDGNPSALDSAGATTYALDNAFRITGITDLSDASRTWSYSYDLLDRLTSGSRASQTVGYTYDANGNRLAQTGTASATYTVSGTSNRLSSTSGSPARTYSYDNGGNTIGYAGLSFTYSDAGRLKSASVSSVTTQYTLNALGQRIRKSDPSSTRLFVYDESGHLLGEYDGTGALVQETVWLDDIPVATVRPGTSGVDVYYVHTDHLNTPRRLTRPADNAVVWRWDSDPFGNGAPNEDSDGDSVSVRYNLRFPGQYYDGESGLSYNYFRDYDSSTGRYVESDPIGLHGGINTYAYVLNYPILFSDSLGLDPAMCRAALRGIGAILGGAAGASCGCALGAAAGGAGGTLVGGPVVGTAAGAAAGCAAGGVAVGTVGAAAGAAVGDAAANLACDEEEPDCKKATPWQLVQAGIEDPHEFKTDYGAVPNSRFDICACKDGSIVIKAVGSCGKSSPGISTHARWK